MVGISLKRVLFSLEKRSWFVFWGFFFRIALEFGYIKFVVPVYSYSGYILDLGFIKYFESWALFVFMLFIFPRKIKKPSDFLMIYMLFGFLTPLLCYYGLANQNRLHLYMVLFCVTLIFLFRVGKNLNIKTVFSGKIIAILFLIVASFSVTFWMFASGGLNYFNLNLMEVYDFRRDVGQVINVGPMGYVNVWATKVFGPTLLALSLWKKKYFYALIIVGLHVVWFGVSSHRSVLFYPALVAFIFIWFKNTRALSLVSIGMSFPVLFSIFLFLIMDNVILGGLFIRRVFFVPASLTFTYYDFFSSRPFVFWSNNITATFIDYPYHVGTAKLIGEYLGTGAAANNSFLATGYMHAGFFGIILYGVVCGILFRIIDSLSIRSLPHWVALSIVIIPSQSLIMNSDLPTSILTHGFGTSLLVLFFLRGRRDPMKAEAL